MKQAVGGAYVYNMVIVFLLIAFGFLMATFSYSKAYRVSKGVVALIENYSGYAGATSPTETAIVRYLNTVGYNTEPIEKSKCPKKKNAAGQSKSAKWSTSGVCIYEIDETTYSDANNDTQTRYVTYGVVSYMRIDLPLVNVLRVPVYGETEKIYVFH